MEFTTTAAAALNNGIKILVHGPAGAGKTTLCGTTGDDVGTLVLSAEAGLLPLANRQIPCHVVGTTKGPDGRRLSPIEDLRHVYSYLRKGDHPFRWVCIDSITEIGDLCLDTELRRVNDKGNLVDPRQAYGEMAKQVVTLLRAFRDLPINVVMSASQAMDKDDVGRTRFVPMMPGKQVGQKIPYLFDEVLALHVDTGDDGAARRWLQTGRCARYEAKDRSGRLDPAEPPDLAAIATKITGVASATN